MDRAKASVVAMAVTCMASTGCVMSTADGARKVFSESFYCPDTNVTVTPRPDAPPHTLLGHGADGTDPTPPPDVAADPARLQMWTAMAAQKAAAIDSLGETYLAEGCGKKALLVCGHPTTLDIAAGNGVVVGNMTTTANDSVVSAVRCVSGQQANNGKLGLGFLELEVSEVRNGSPAARAGFAPGDVITEVDHQRVAADADVVRLLLSPTLSGHVVLVVRAGSPVELTIPP